MELINLLSKKDKKITDRKKLIRYVLLAFAFICMAFSITSGFFFIEATLTPFPLPVALVVLMGLGVALLVDIGQTMAVTHLAVDYYEDKVVEPFTVVVAVVFVVLSGYISIAGTQTRHDKVALEQVQSDSTNRHLETALSTSAPLVNKVVKTKDIDWLEYNMLKEEAKLAAKQAELHKDNVSAATTLTKELKAKKAKEENLVRKLFDASAFTLVAIQVVFLFCVFGAGYFKVVTSQTGPSGGRPKNKRQIVFGGPENLGEEPKQRSKVNHLGSHLHKDLHKGEDIHKDCVSTETQSIVLNGSMCTNCGKSFVPKHPRQKFCSNKGPSNCKDVFNNKNR